MREWMKQLTKKEMGTETKQAQPLIPEQEEKLWSLGISSLCTGPPYPFWFLVSLVGKTCVQLSDSDPLSCIMFVYPTSLCLFLFTIYLYPNLAHNANFIDYSKPPEPTGDFKEQAGFNKSNNNKKLCIHVWSKWMWNVIIFSLSRYPTNGWAGNWKYLWTKQSGMILNSLIECRIVGRAWAVNACKCMTLLSMNLRLKRSVCIMSNVCMWYRVCLLQPVNSWF